MNIIFDSDVVSSIKDSNLVLELDTFYFSKSNKTTTAYCVIENISIVDLDKVNQTQKLHADLMDAYKCGNFKLCQDLLEHLTGTFNGEVDSFYFELSKRINEYKSSSSTDKWNSIIVRNC